MIKASFLVFFLSLTYLLLHSKRLLILKDFSSKNYNCFSPLSGTARERLTELMQSMTAKAKKDLADIKEQEQQQQQQQQQQPSKIGTAIARRGDDRGSCGPVGISTSSSSSFITSSSSSIRLFFSSPVAVSNFRRLQTVSNGVEYKKKGGRKRKTTVACTCGGANDTFALVARRRCFFLFFFLVPPPMVVALMKTDVGGRVVVYRVFTEFYVISWIPLELFNKSIPVMKNYN